MSLEEIRKAGISRRAFFKAGTTAAVVVGGSVLVGCSPQASDTNSESSETVPSDSVQAASDLFAAPEPITDIADTKDYDIVVVGLGMAGTCAALAAVEGGAKVAVLQKADIAITHGNFCAVINNEELTDQGCSVIDIDAMIKQFNSSNMNMNNRALIKRYFAESPESGSWLLDRAVEAGAEPIIQTPIPAVKFKGKQIAGVTALADLAVKKGVEVFYSTPGKQLVKDGDNRVTGVIGQDSKGDHIQFNASKGVVIATGCYSNNKDMLEKWSPGAAPFENFYNPPINDGDGHLMGLWAGGRMQEAPHPKMVHVHHYVGDGDINAPMRKAPFLNVNDYGERFMDESVLYDHRCNQAVKYPGAYAIQIFDSNYESQYTSMPDQSDPANDGTLDDFIDWGMAFKADSIEELAGQLDIPADNLKSTVSRYNELVSNGKDEDYLKGMEFMYPINTPPFYGVRRQYVISAITGGLEVDENSNVVDETWQPIPGLYAVGNAQGGMFGGTDYPFDIVGLSMGRAMTFGYMVGRDLARS